MNLAAQRFEVRRTNIWERPPEGGHRKVVGPPKSGRTRRVAISGRFAEALGRWYAEAVVQGGASAEGFVWPGTEGGPMHHRSLAQALERACLRAGVVDDETGRPLVSPHRLRHSAASVMLREGSHHISRRLLAGRARVPTRWRVRTSSPSPKVRRGWQGPRGPRAVEVGPTRKPSFTDVSGRQYPRATPRDEEETMGEAREVMDRVTAAMENNDVEAARSLYAPDAVAETPDEGTLRGADAIADWLVNFAKAFPDAKYESTNEFEIEDTAIDEGYFTGTNTGPLAMPGGQSIPATGKAIRVRACDLATVRDGVITSHRFYFDQMEFLGQLGLAE